MNGKRETERESNIFYLYLISVLEGPRGVGTWHNLLTFLIFLSCWWIANVLLDKWGCLLIQCDSGEFSTHFTWFDREFRKPTSKAIIIYILIGISIRSLTMDRNGYSKIAPFPPGRRRRRRQRHKPRASKKQHKITLPVPDRDKLDDAGREVAELSDSWWLDGVHFRLGMVVW